MPRKDRKFHYTVTHEFPNGSETYTVLADKPLFEGIYDTLNDDQRDALAKALFIDEFDDDNDTLRVEVADDHPPILLDRAKVDEILSA